jgi:hypothetical protein
MHLDRKIEGCGFIDLCTGLAKLGAILRNSCPRLEAMA